MSKMPAWATVGTDIPQEELLDYLRTQAKKETPQLSLLLELLYPALALLLVLFLVVAGYYAYRDFQSRKQLNCETDALSDQLHQSLAQKETLTARLEEMTVRLQALEEAKRSLRARSSRRSCCHHRHRSRCSTTLSSTSHSER